MVMESLSQSQTPMRRNQDEGAGMRTVALPSGEVIPVLGQGTWQIGEHRSRRAAEIAALRLGLDLGLTLIDTAEMYADGGAEEVVGEAVADRRDEVFIVSKLYPHNATRRGTIAACERSLCRLGTDRIDLYLLHWRGAARLDDLLEAFAELVQAGKIRHYGVSNFDTGDLASLWALPGGAATATDQVLYSLTRRGIETGVLPWCRSRGVPVMAYSSLDQGRLRSDGALTAVATRHGVTPHQVALAWVLRQDGVLTIPKAVTPAHVRQNRAALDLSLTPEDLAELDRSFPPPRGAVPLDMA